MNAANKLWPLRDDYQKAVLDPKRNIKDPRLHAMQVEMKKMGAFEVPFSRNGNFGAVYKFVNAREAYALKVFADSQPEREQRYSMIHHHLGSYPAARSLVSFSYEPSGIRIRGSWYPTLVMDWAEGDTLRMYLNTILERGGQVNNGQLCMAWAQAIYELIGRQMAHGDLQHGNILVMPDGSMKLVDYDGMFVPAMQHAGMTAIEFGMAAYQHPKRYRGYFDKRLDDFGALVILLTLAAVNRTRWQRCHKDDAYLLIKEADLLKPDQSALLTELANSTDAPVKKLAVMVKRAAQGSIETIPPFEQIAADHTIRQLFDPAWRPSDTASHGKSVSQVVKDIKPPAGPSVIYSDPHVQQLVPCSSCQKGLKPSDTFCRYCGKSVAAATQPAQVKAGKCGYCNADFIAGDQFCRKCGKAPGSPSFSVQPQGAYTPAATPPKIGNTPAAIQPPVNNLQPVKKEVEPWSSAKMLFVTFSIGGAILLAGYLLEGKITSPPFWLAVLFFIIGISGAIQNRKTSN